VGQQVADGHGAARLGGAGLRRQRLGAESRQEFGDGVVEPQLAFFDEHQHAHGRDRLGHRGDPEHRVAAHRPLAGDVRQSEGLQRDRAAGRHDQGHRPGELAAVLQFLQGIAEDRILFMQVGSRAGVRGGLPVAAGREEDGEEGGKDRAHRR
jgi:hypothetical protein